MSNSFTGDDVLAEMTEGQTADPALNAQVADQESLASERLELLKLANSLVDDRPTKKTPALETDRNSIPIKAKKPKHKKRRRVRSRTRSKARASEAAIKQRFGLPDGFVPRLQRYGRSVLLEQNIYRLPNGDEYLPTHPLGTLGSRQHLYALLTVDQYVARRRGSVYIRNDGRIFDYSMDGGIPGGDLFDTGYTIYDLERTGSYAPSLKQKRTRHPAVRHHRASAGG
ncbi:MAG TPA: hypothetical protein VJU86_02415 [Pyrinomonadaceae bacterium]|nr:hypothetical protein [Pyrinomonadaceae bacterium]